MKNRIPFIILLFSSLSFFTFGENKAKQNQSGFTLFGNGETFHLDVVTDSVLFGAGLTLNGTSLIIDKTSAQKSPSFPYNIDDINAFDRMLAFQYSGTLHKISTVSCITGLLSPALLAFTTDSGEWFTIAAMYAETVLLTNGIKELTKTLVFRPRPYMYFEGYPQKKIDEGDWEDSFFSGHTAHAFSGAAFTSFVFAKYYPDSPWRYAVTAGSFALAAATGIMRVAGGNHFVTDVLVGAAVGTACGILVPYLHTLGGGYGNGESSSALSAQITPLGVCFSVKL